MRENRQVEVAYVNAHLVKSGRQVRVLVDSGNLVGDLVSKAFVDSLGLTYRPDRRPIATASTEGRLMSIGVCDPLQLKVQGLDRVFPARPLVVGALPGNERRPGRPRAEQVRPSVQCPGRGAANRRPSYGPTTPGTSGRETTGTREAKWTRTPGGSQGRTGAQPRRQPGDVAPKH